MSLTTIKIDSSSSNQRMIRGVLRGGFCGLIVGMLAGSGCAPPPAPAPTPPSDGFHRGVGMPEVAIAPIEVPAPPQDEGDERAE